MYLLINMYYKQIYIYILINNLKKKYLKNNNIQFKSLILQCKT